jgi:hypothetical protein
VAITNSEFFRFGGSGSVMGKNARRVSMALLVVNEMRTPKNTSNEGLGQRGSNPYRTFRRFDYMQLAASERKTFRGRKQQARVST